MQDGAAANVGRNGAHGEMGSAALEHAAKG